MHKIVLRIPDIDSSLVYGFNYSARVIELLSAHKYLFAYKRCIKNKMFLRFLKFEKIRLIITVRRNCNVIVIIVKFVGNLFGSIRFCHCFLLNSTRSFYVVIR